MWDVEVIKAAIIGGAVAFFSSGLFYQIVKLGINKLVGNLTLSVGKLKEQNVITQEQHDMAVSEIIKRESQLLDKVEDVLDKLPNANSINNIDAYFGSIASKIDAFLDGMDSEVDDE